MGLSTINRAFAWFFLLTASSIGFCFPAMSQTITGADTDAVAAAMHHLSIDIPAGVAESQPVRGPLEALGREPCDQKAIQELGVALDKVGRRREAANAHIGFSTACGRHAPSLRAAVNILLSLSDYARAASVASDLIALESFNDNGYYLRAVAYDRGGLPKQAVDDYVTAIELFGNKENISSVGYFALARTYEKLGQFCDAVSAIESWVSLNPARNDTSQTRARIADYSAKGRCEAAAAGSEEVFNIPRPSSTIKLPVTINGAQGTLLLDTGATFVSLKSRFAQRAGVQIDQDSTIRLRTANGVTDGKRGRAQMIQLRSLQVKDVPIVVQTDDRLALDGVDGLLGMSFLSHFNVSVDTQAVRISKRRPK